MTEELKPTSTQNADQVTYTNNPRKDILKKRERAQMNIERALNLIAKIKALYESFDEEKHSEYCQALYSALTVSYNLLVEFRYDQ